MSTQTLLRRALRFQSQPQLAKALGVTERTIRRWLREEQVPRAAYLSALRQEIGNEPIVSSASFSFIDLFAGIGGLRRAFEPLGGRCVFSSEWDKYACKTYKANF